MGERRVRGRDAGPCEFIAYPQALNLLTDRLGATPEEIAAWLFLGPEEGGLAGFAHVHEFKDPPRFRLWLNDDNDYLSQLMGAWFRSDDIEALQHPPRFITYPDLLKRWSGKPGIHPKAFILAKIVESDAVEDGEGLPESRLRHLHPICGGTQAMVPGVDGLPGIEEGLFFISDVESIEAADFGRKQHEEIQRESDDFDESSESGNFEKADAAEQGVETCAPASAAGKAPRQRHDAISAEIEQVLDELGNEQKPSPHQVMLKLKARAGNEGSCISESGSDFVLWRYGSGEPSKLTMENLRKRLDRRAKKGKASR